MSKETSRNVEAIILLILVAIGVGFVYYYGTPNIRGTVIFGLSALAVMTFHYLEGWVNQPNRGGLLDYLVIDNPGEAYDAVKRLALLCGGSSLIGHFDHLLIEHIITAGAGVGHMAFGVRHKQGG